MVHDNAPDALDTAIVEYEAVTSPVCNVELSWVKVRVLVRVAYLPANGTATPRAAWEAPE